MMAKNNLFMSKSIHTFGCAQKSWTAMKSHNVMQLLLATTFTGVCESADTDDNRYDNDCYNYKYNKNNTTRQSPIASLDKGKRQRSIIKNSTIIIQMHGI